MKRRTHQVLYLLSGMWANRPRVGELLFLAIVVCAVQVSTDIPLLLLAIPVAVIVLAMTALMAVKEHRRWGGHDAD